MSLLDSVKAETKADGATPVAETKKKSNSDYQKKQLEHQYAAACKIRDFLNSKKIELPEDVKEELAFLCKEKKSGASSSAFGTPVIYRLFGNTPKKGDKVTALKVFEVSGKGFAEMRQLMKKWKEKQGITVEYDTKAQAYVIKDGNIPAFEA